MSVDLDTDRPGGDYHDFRPDRASADRCAQACLRDDACAAFTCLPPGVRGAAAHRWLKDTVPEARARPGMVSGAKRSLPPRDAGHHGRTYRNRGRL